MTAETSNARGEWVLVPREPTEAMLDAMHSRIRILCDPAARTADIQNDREVWAAMLAAAPPAPVSVPLDRLTALDGLVDRIAETIRDGAGLAEGDPPWERLGEERRAPWRADARRAISVIKESLTAETRTPQPADAEPRTLPVPTRVYLTDKAAVIVGDPQRGWDEEGPEAHNCDDMGCSTIGPHVLARVPFTDERAPSQQPEARVYQCPRCATTMEVDPTAKPEARGVVDGWKPADVEPPHNPKKDSLGTEYLIHPPTSGGDRTAFYGRRLGGAACWYRYGAPVHGVEYWHELPADPAALTEARNVR